MTTTFKAEGASFLTLVSPPGWYWYGPAPPSCFQGSLSVALETDRSDEALVGERAVSVSYKSSARMCEAGWIGLSHGDLQKCQPARPKTPLMMTRSTCRGQLASSNLF